MFSRYIPPVYTETQPTLVASGPSPVFTAVGSSDEIFLTDILELWIWPSPKYRFHPQNSYNIGCLKWESP